MENKFGKRDYLKDKSLMLTPTKLLHNSHQQYITLIAKNLNLYTQYLIGFGMKLRHERNKFNSISINLIFFCFLHDSDNTANKDKFVDFPLRPRIRSRGNQIGAF